LEPLFVLQVNWFAVLVAPVSDAGLRTDCRLWIGVSLPPDGAGKLSWPPLARVRIRSKESICATSSGFSQPLSLTLAATVKHPQPAFPVLVAIHPGGIVPGVNVIAKHDSTGQTRQAQTGAAGINTINLLPIGGYTISASASGFQNHRYQRDHAASQSSSADRYRSRIGSLAETVSVTEAGAAPADGRRPRWAR